MTIGAVFPGQGAQSVGMLAELAQAYKSVGERFAEASEALGFDMWAMVQNGPAEDLSATQNTQPVLLTSSIAVWDVWQAQADAPAFVAGHSLGEYSALCAAGSIGFAEAVKLVRLRGELMEKATPRGLGAMAAVMGLDDDAVKLCCSETEGVVVAANFNAPGQVVIAGEAEAVEAAAQQCKSAGAKRAVMLDVSCPFHSPLMTAAKIDFADALDGLELQMPNVPIVQNVNAGIPDSLQELRENLLAQIAEPVLWSRCIAAMLDRGVDRFVEVGPGNILAGLIRRISKGTPTQGLGTPDGVEAAVMADE